VDAVVPWSATEKVDVFSLGITFQEVLSHLRKIYSSSVETVILSDLNSLFEKMVQRSPDKRPEVGLVREEITQILLKYDRSQF
jgi:hypothetical protein